MSRAAAIALALSLALVGCGDSGTGGGSSTQATSAQAAQQPEGAAKVSPDQDDEAEIRKVAAEFAEAFNAKDWDRVCEQLSPKAKREILTGMAAYSGKIESCEDAMTAVSDLAGEDMDVAVTTVRITGDTAVAENATTGDDGEAEDANFERIDGRWYVGADEPEDSGEALRARAKTWPKAWCAVKAGASREQLRAAMGEPTSDLEEQDQWSGYGSSYTAFYDPDLNAYQLQVGEGSVPCAKVRKAAGRE